MSETTAKTVGKQHRPAANGGSNGAENGGPAPAPVRPSADTWYWVAAVGVALLAALLQLYRIGDTLRGFHLFNEGFYLLNGIKDAGRGLFAPALKPIDPNMPPVYALELAWTLKVFGESVVVARLLSVAASLASVILTFGLGRKLYNAKVGILAAALFAFAPIQIVAGRNIQTDAVMLAFMLAALLAYVYAVASERVWWSIAAGLFAALAVLTKVPAVLLLVALAVWQTWRTGGLGWLRLRSTWISLATFAAFVVPWYLYRFLGSAEFRGAQQNLAGSGGWHGLHWVWDWVLKQWFWMLSPLLFVAVVAAVVWIAIKRQPADKLLLSYLGVYGLFFVFYNVHAYYFLPLVPVAAIAVGRALFSIGAKQVRWVAVAAVIGALLILPFTALELSIKKYSPVPTEALVPALERNGFDPKTVILWVDKPLYDQIGPTIELAARDAGIPEVMQFAGQVAAAPAGMRNVLLGGKLASPVPGVTFIEAYHGVNSWPALFGYAVTAEQGNYNFWNLPRLSLKHVGKPYFGWYHTEYDNPNEELYSVVP